MVQQLDHTQFVHALADMDRQYAALLFGAGASRSSGVLLAREIVHDLCRTAYCREFKITGAQRDRISAAEVREWLELQQWYLDAKARGESDYSAVFRRFKPTHDHQIEYIRGLLKSAVPSPGYKALAALAHEDVFPVLLTTNFDPLLENSYGGMYLSESSLRSVATPDEFVRVTFSPGQRVLGYLHGNLNGYQIANLDEHTRFLRDDIQAAMKRMLNPFALVVVGYSGNDQSVMQLLLHLAKTEPSAFRRGVVYWCRRRGSELSGQAKELLETVDQGFDVEVPGFDRLVLDIASELGLDSTPWTSTPPGVGLESNQVAAEPAVLNVAVCDRLPAEIVKLRTGLKDRDDVAAYRDDYSRWQATVHDGHLWLIGDPAELPAELRDRCSESAERIELTKDSLVDAEVWNIFSELANKALDQFLRVDHQLRPWKGRYFFTKPKNSDERSVTYLCRRRKAKRRVVWSEFERGGEGQKTRYFCHEAARIRIIRFREEPVLRLLPTRIFTIEGEEVWDSDTAHTSIGRSTSKVWNQAYDSLIRMWLEVLSKDSDRVTIRFSADGRKEQFRLPFLGIPCAARKVKQ